MASLTNFLFVWSATSVCFKRGLRLTNLGPERYRFLNHFPPDVSVSFKPDLLKVAHCSTLTACLHASFHCPISLSTKTLHLVGCLCRKKKSKRVSGAVMLRTTEEQMTEVQTCMRDVNVVSGVHIEPNWVWAEPSRSVKGQEGAASPQGHRPRAATPTGFYISRSTSGKRRLVSTTSGNVLQLPSRELKPRREEERNVMLLLFLLLLFVVMSHNTRGFAKI